jgi:hypothetical protein
MDQEQQPSHLFSYMNHPNQPRIYSLWPGENRSRYALLPDKISMRAIACGSYWEQKK